MLFCPDSVPERATVTSMHFVMGFGHSYPSLAVRGHLCWLAPSLTLWRGWDVGLTKTTRNNCLWVWVMRACKSDGKLTLLHWRHISWYMYTRVTSGRLCFGICVVLFSSGIIVILIYQTHQTVLQSRIMLRRKIFWKKKRETSRNSRFTWFFSPSKMGNHLKKCRVGWWKNSPRSTNSLELNYLKKDWLNDF